MDFTITLFKKLITALKSQKYSFQTFKEFISSPHEKSVVLRHDVDLLPHKSLYFAHLESDLKIKGTYYFRISEILNRSSIIKSISDLGHEIGYHYEDLSIAFRKHKKQLIKNDLKIDEKKIVDLSIISFQENLNKLRKIVSVNTICSHGSPLSIWDNRILWNYYDYRSFGILGEPYLDVDYSKVLYLTDTGRRWNGNNVNIRDKIFNDKSIDNTLLYTEINVKSTYNLINSVYKGHLPNQIIMTFHPQRWTNQLFPWLKELLSQNIKNVGKYFLIQIRKS